MDVDAAIRSRRSVGTVSSDPIDRDTIADLLTSATMAPTHHLRQPWRFIVLRGDSRMAVGRAHARAFVRSNPECAPTLGEREAHRLMRAPVVIAVIVRHTTDDAVGRREDRDAVAAATQNLLLAAHGRGLGAIWRTGSMPDEPEVRDALSLDDVDEIVAFVYLGMPTALPSSRSRTPADQLTQWRDQ